MADALGVQTGSVSAYKQRPNANPSPEKIERVIAKLKSELGIDDQALKLWFLDGKPTEPPLKKVGDRAKEKTNVYYNGGDENSGPGADVVGAIEDIADPRIVRLKVLEGDGSRIWSAKDAQRSELRTYSYVVAGGRILIRVVDDSLGASFNQKWLAFEPDSYPHVGPFLLCQSRSDEHLRTIRFISAANPGVLSSVDPKEPPVKLEDWKVLGFATVELIPHPAGLPDVNIRPAGIGPR